jgi:hypothetical protein
MDRFCKAQLFGVLVMETKKMQLFSSIRSWFIFFIHCVSEQKTSRVGFSQKALFYNFRQKGGQAGQALLIVILVMVVALTIGLSVATRNVTNLRLTTEEQSSQRALSAAEAGIEQALKSSGTGVIVGGSNNPTKQLGDAEIQKVEIKSISGQQLVLNNGAVVPRGESIDVWLSTYDPTGGSFSGTWSGNLEVFWHDKNVTCTNSNANTIAALDIFAIYQPVSGGLQNAEVKHFAVDPCSDRRTQNYFCAVSQSGSSCQLPSGTGADPSSTFFVLTSPENVVGTQMKYRARLRFGQAANNAPQPGILVRITPLYADTVIGVKGTTSAGAPLDLPAQGSVIESTGSSGSTQRKISVHRPYPKIPTELFYAVFAP